MKAANLGATLYNMATHSTEPAEHGCELVPVETVIIDKTNSLHGYSTISRFGEKG